MKIKTPSLYLLYEEAVQTPDVHAETFSLMYTELNGKKAHILREDFCGTFLISCEWVKLNPNNKALSLDIDSKPLNYGKTHHLKNLKQDEQKRIKILQKNVISITKPLSDIVCACNFSFNVFKERKTLVRYFQCVFKSLKKNGIFILELAGGPGMIEKTIDKKTINSKKAGKFIYYWDQKDFNPITHDALYAIHFKLNNGKMIKNAFTYDWRLWTIPELREALTDAGFKKTYTYWDVKDNDEYVRTEKGDNAYSWGAFVVGHKI
jgi:SAM-dependent methyltransferase